VFSKRKYIERLLNGQKRQMKVNSVQATSVNIVSKLISDRKGKAKKMVLESSMT